MARSRHTFLILAAAALAIGAGPGAHAEPAPPGDAARADAIRVELHLDRARFGPEGPILLRFGLVNTLREPVDVPLDPPLSADGQGLPLRLVLGTAGHPALVVYQDDDQPRNVQPGDLPAPDAEAKDTLRLAPLGVAGARIDFRSLYPAARYPGSYRVVWRPLDGRFGSAVVTFRVDVPKEAIVVTDQGKISFTLLYDVAPQNVENFMSLVEEGFYTGKTFHRVTPGLGLQGGCPRGDGTGTRPDGRLVPAELSDLPIDAGTLIMARKDGDLNSASCQFFIASERLPELDGQYTIVGQATDEASLRVIRQLVALPTDADGRPLRPLVIRSISLVDAPTARVRRLELQPTRGSSSAPSSIGELKPVNP